MSFIRQNFRIKADQYSAIPTAVNGEMLQRLQCLIWFVDLYSHLIPRMQKDIAEYEGSPNLTVEQ